MRTDHRAEQNWPMLKLVALVALLLVTTTANAQWSTSSNDVYKTNTAGNVGIGTTSPGDKLEVYGNIRFTDNIVESLLKRADGVNTLIKTSRTDDTQFGKFRTNGWGDFTVDRSFAVGYDLSGTGYGTGSFFAATALGVGTTTPTSWGAFAVRTSAALNGKNVSASLSDGVHSTFDIRHPANNIVDLSAENSALTFSTVTGSSTDGAERMRIDTSGNVGIGTTNPGALFHVHANADENLWVRSAGRINITAANDAGSAFAPFSIESSSLLLNSGSGGNVGIGTATPGAKLEVTGAIRNSAANGFSVGNDSGRMQLLTSGTIFQFLTSTSGAATAQIGGLAIANTYATNPPAAGLYVEGSVGIGTSAGSYKLNVDGSINSTQTITGNNIVAKYQDVAEWVPSSEQLPAGTVVVLDSTKANQVTSSTVSYDTRVAGVISGQPGIALGEKGDGKVLVATTGRVRVKVDATKSPIHIGDLLVTSDVPGVAMKSEPVEFAGRKMHMPGTLIGKAQESLEKGKGEIVVLLSLQ
jgi:hypothetical protein